MIRERFRASGQRLLPAIYIISPSQAYLLRPLRVCSFSRVQFLLAARPVRVVLRLALCSRQCTIVSKILEAFHRRLAERFTIAHVELNLVFVQPFDFVAATFGRRFAAAARHRALGLESRLSFASASTRFVEISVTTLSFGCQLHHCSHGAVAAPCFHASAPTLATFRSSA